MENINFKWHFYQQQILVMFCNACKFISFEMCHASCDSVVHAALQFVCDHHISAACMRELILVLSFALYWLLNPSTAETCCHANKSCTSFLNSRYARYQEQLIVDLITSWVSHAHNLQQGKVTSKRTAEQSQTSSAYLGLVELTGHRGLHHHRGPLYCKRLISILSCPAD